MPRSALLAQVEPHPSNLRDADDFEIVSLGKEIDVYSLRIYHDIYVQICYSDSLLST